MDKIEEVLREFANQGAENERLRESINDLASRINEANFDLLESFDETNGISLENLKGIAKKLRDMSTSSLLKRGAQLRHSYVFGRGIIFTKVPPRVKTLIEKPYNMSAAFTQRAWEEMNMALFTDGNLFITRNKATNVLTRIPLDQITDFEFDPDSAERIWHIKRQWTVKDKTYEVWYPLNTYEGNNRRVIDGVKVDNDYVIYHEAVNKQIGWTLGIPDGFAAMAWVMAYTEYLKDNSKLVKAYSMLAFRLSQPTKKGVQGAAAAVATGGTGGTAITGPGAELASMPATGSQVNFGNGRPLASQVAASLGVSVVALLADPGAAGSSYGAAQTLDFPTIRVMGAIQDGYVRFFKTLLEDFGATPGKFEVAFPAIETDVPYRQLASLAQLYTTGAIFQEEYRAAALALTDIPDAKGVKELPVPDNFNVAHLTPDEEAEREDEKADQDALARQGNSGAAGSQNHDKNDARDNGELD